MFDDILNKEELKLDKNIEMAKKLEKVRCYAGLAYEASKYGQIVMPEPFTITSLTGEDGTVSITPNKVNVRSNITMFVVPKGHMFVFDADDRFQYVYFTPHTLNNEFIIGDLEVILEKADGNEKPKTIIHYRSKIMKPETPPYFRRWEHDLVAVRGDKINVYFTCNKVLSPEKTDLEIRIRDNKIVLE